MPPRTLLTTSIMFSWDILSPSPLRRVGYATVSQWCLSWGQFVLIDIMLEREVRRANRWPIWWSLPFLLNILFYPYFFTRRISIVHKLLEIRRVNYNRSFVWKSIILIPVWVKKYSTVSLLWGQFLLTDIQALDIYSDRRIDDLSNMSKERQCWFLVNISCFILFYI